MNRDRPPAAIVIGMDNATGLQSARILTARGVPVIGIAKDPDHFCCRTRISPRRSRLTSRSRPTTRISLRGFLQTIEKEQYAADQPRQRRRSECELRDQRQGAFAAHNRADQIESDGVVRRSSQLQHAAIGQVHALQASLSAENVSRVSVSRPTFQSQRSCSASAALTTTRVPFHRRRAVDS